MKSMRQRRRHESCLVRMQNKCLQSKRGQTSAVELLVGSVLILLIVVALIGLWDKSFASNKQSRFLDDFDLTAQKAIDRLVQTGGNPPDWETQPDLSNVTALGIAQTPQVLDKTKIMQFVAYADASISPADYNKTKELLGSGNLDFEFNMYEIIADTRIPLPQYQTGKQISSSNYYVISKERVVVLDDETYVAEMKFYYPHR